MADDALTRDFTETIVERARRDPAFAEALVAETEARAAEGQQELARLIRRVLAGAMGRSPS